MKHQNEVSDLIRNWSSRSEFAAELGVTVSRVHKWVASGSIPSRYWKTLIELADGKGVPLTGDDLIQWHSKAA